MAPRTSTGSMRRTPRPGRERKRASVALADQGAVAPTTGPELPAGPRRRTSPERRRPSSRTPNPLRGDDAHGDDAYRDVARLACLARRSPFAWSRPRPPGCLALPRVPRTRVAEELPRARTTKTSSRPCGSRTRPCSRGSVRPQNGQGFGLEPPIGAGGPAFGRWGASHVRLTRFEHRSTMR